VKVVQLKVHGGPEVLEFVDAPDPTPGPGQILIKVESASVNFSDTMRRRDEMPASSYDATRDWALLAKPSIVEGCEGPQDGTYGPYRTLIVPVDGNAKSIGQVGRDDQPLHDSTDIDRGRRQACQ
jgi:hypothetical protein